MRLLICLSLLLGPAVSRAWDTAPHQRITKAALDALPPRVLALLGTEAASLADIYCMYPDRYLEMADYGFVRNSPGPRTISEIVDYCVRPDGAIIHGSTGDKDDDMDTLVYLFERVLANRDRNRPREAAQYAGVVAHFIEDSLSPPHAVTAVQLRGMAPRSAGAGFNVHSAIERSLPEFTLRNRLPRLVGARIAPAAQATLQECYAGAARNRQDLPAMVKAACARDERTLDFYRRRAGVRAAEILSDALYTVLAIDEAAR